MPWERACKAIDRGTQALPLPGYRLSHTKGYHVAFGIDDAIANVASLIKAGVDRIWPDPTERLKNETEQLKVLVDRELQEFKGRASIIVAEAQGGSWLQRSWRPITMLVFLGLVVGHFFGLEGPNFGAEDSSHLFTLIEIGLGGYVIGRTVEKVAPTIVDAIRK